MFNEYILEFIAINTVRIFFLNTWGKSSCHVARGAILISYPHLKGILKSLPFILIMYLTFKSLVKSVTYWVSPLSG